MKFASFSLVILGLSVASSSESVACSVGDIPLGQNRDKVRQVLLETRANLDSTLQRSESPRVTAYTVSNVDRFGKAGREVFRFDDNEQVTVVEWSSLVSNEQEVQSIVAHLNEDFGKATDISFGEDLHLFWESGDIRYSIFYDRSAGAITYFYRRADQHKAAR